VQITGYEISINSSGWVAVPELKRDTIITGLTNSMPYTFRIHAINAAGEGPVATVTATSASYGIILSPPPTSFPFDTYGYDALAPLTVTVTNTGTQPTGPLTATLTGINPGAFGLAPDVPSPDGTPPQVQSSR
jgi:hypothetical protein